MRVPGAHIADQVKNYEDLACIGNIWVLARPLAFQNCTERWKRAWDVFIGKADALYWKGQ